MTLATIKGQVNNKNLSLLNTNSSSQLLSSNTSLSMSMSSTSPPSQTPSIIWPEPDRYYDEEFIEPFIPPWGEPAFVYDDDDIVSAYRSGISHFEDTRHYGWSWSPPYLNKSAPFCYVRRPRPFWTQSWILSLPLGDCYDISLQCGALGGTVFNDVICMEDPAKPFTVVGPVCWNQTCYNEATVSACEAVGGQFIGGQNDATFNASKFYENLILLNNSKENAFLQAFFDNEPISDAAWCAVPGKLTLVGPACYGQKCFKEELSAVCNTTLQGTTFAYIFCLVDDAYTVIVPICTPSSIHSTHNRKSHCFPDETLALCQEMIGTSIGDIFCVVKGDCSILGPFCKINIFGNGYYITQKFIDSECYNVSNACKSLGGSPLGNGAFCILKGEYSFVRPDGPHPNDANNDNVSWCEKQGGTKIVNKPFDKFINEFGCILKGKYTIVGPLYWDGHLGYDTPDITTGSVIDESNIFHSSEYNYFILKGGYSVYQPSWFVDNCRLDSGMCLSAGGVPFGLEFCAVPDDGTSTIMKKRTTSNAIYNNINFTQVTFMLCMSLSLKFNWGSI